MNCATAREALSAMLDGEEPGVGSASVDAHLASCAPCRAWRDEATHLDRLMRITPVPAEDPVLADRILARATPPRRRSVRRRLVVAALTVVGLAQLFVGGVSLAMPLGMGHGMVAGAHMDHESAAFNLAFGAALLVVSLNAERARAMLPMLAVFVGVLGVASVFDVTDGQVNLARLATHLPIVAGLVLTALLSRSVRRDHGPSATEAERDESQVTEKADAERAARRPAGRREQTPPAARRDVA